MKYRFDDRGNVRPCEICDMSPAICDVENEHEVIEVCAHPPCHEIALDALNHRAAQHRAEDPRAQLFRLRAELAKK